MINSDSGTSPENVNGMLSVPLIQVETVAECDPTGGFLSTQVDFNINGGTDIKSNLILFEDEVVNKENVGVGVKNRRRSGSELKINPLHTIEQNKTVFNEVNMDISIEQLDEPNCEHLTNRTCLLESSMDCTEFIEHGQVQNLLNRNKTISDSDTVDYTCAIPIINITPAGECIKNNEDFQTMEFTQAISINNLVTEVNKDIILTNINMEQTSPLERPLIERPISPKSILKKQSIYLNTVRNESNISEGTDSDVVEMELSSPINIGNIYNTAVDQVPKQMLPEHIAANSDISSVNVLQSTVKVLNEINLGGTASITPVLNPAKCGNTRTSFIEELQIFTSKSNSTHDVNNQSHQFISRSPSHLCTRISLSLPSKTTLTDIVQPAKVLNSLTSSANVKSKENETIHKDRLIFSTPIGSEPSFKDKSRNSYMNCHTLSLCADDTQQLINYNLSNQQSKSDFSKIIAGDLNPSFINSKLMALSSFSSDFFPVSLESTLELKDRKKSLGLQSTYLITNNTDENNQKKLSSLESIPHAMKINSSLSDQKKSYTSPTKNMISNVFPASLETTPKLKDRNSRDLLQVTNSNDMKRSSSEAIPQTKKLLSHVRRTTEELNISQENLTLSDSILSINSPTVSFEAQHNVDNIVDVANNSDQFIKNRELWQKYLKSYNSEMDFIKEQSNKILKRLVDGKSIVKELKEQYSVEVQVLSQFLKQCNVDEMENDFNSSSSITEPTSQNSFSACQTNIDFTLNLERTLTLEEKIQEKLKRGKTSARMLSIDGDLCKMAMLYDTLCIDVDLTKDSGIIQKLDVHSNLSDDSEPIALLVHQNLMNCLKDKTIQSALGERYDILSLLDYIGLNKRNSFKIMDQFRYFEKRYACKMDDSFRAIFYIINLRFIWCIYVDMSDLDNISKDSVTFASEIKGVYERDIKKFLVKNLKGLNFLKSFLNDVSMYASCTVKKYV